MVFPNQLVETLAGVLDVPVQTVAQHDRILVLSGHRKSGGRGRSAARLTPADAANLIIAVVGAPVSGPTVRDSAKNFERYAWLPAVENAVVREPAKWSSELGILQHLHEGHAFRDALAALITAFGPTLKTPDVFRQAAEDPFKSISDVSILVELHGPMPEASIAISGAGVTLKPGRDGFDIDDFAPENLEYAMFYGQSLARLLDENDEQEGLQFRRRGDLHQIRAITEVTIEAIAQLFWDERAAGK
jgi:hypothetical protein